MPSHMAIIGISRFTQLITARLKFWFASGNGGNKIYLAPELNMVVSVMSDAYGQGRSHRRSENILISILEHKTL